MPYQHAFTIVILLLSKTNYAKTSQASLEILFNQKILLNQLPAGCWEKATIAPAICHNKPNKVIIDNNLRKKVTTNGSIYIRAKQGMYGLPQAGLLANELLEKRLNKHSYHQSKLVPGLWKHDT